MQDIISQDDALLIDESKNQIINNKVYDFVYDAELYCKMLKKPTLQFVQYHIIKITSHFLLINQNSLKSSDK